VGGWHLGCKRVGVCSLDPALPNLKLLPLFGAPRNLNPNPTPRLTTAPRNQQVHSDLKARNVLLKTASTDDGRGFVAKVGDFGLSLQLPEGASHVSGAFQGTMVRRLWVGWLVGWLVGCGWVGVGVRFRALVGVGERADSVPRAASIRSCIPAFMHPSIP